MHFLENLELYKPFYIDTALYEARCSQLHSLLENFEKKIGFTPYVGIELEFYIVGQNGKSLDTELDEVFCNKLFSVLSEELGYLPSFETPLLDLTLERGYNQFELTTMPTGDLLALSRDITNLKKIIKKIAEQNGYFATFLTQPFTDDCSSALQFNISLCDRNTKRNIFSRILNRDTNKKVDNEFLLKSVSGLYDILEDTLAFFAHAEDAYHRYDLNKNLSLHQEGKFLAPTKVCWGGNNRTTSIRIPATRFVREEYEPDRRIEYRLGGADINPELALISLLVGIQHGLTNHLSLPEKIQGSVYEKNTGDKLKDLAHDLDDSMNNFDKKEVLKYFEVI